MTGTFLPGPVDSPDRCGGTSPTCRPHCFRSSKTCEKFLNACLLQSVPRTKARRKFLTIGDIQILPIRHFVTVFSGCAHPRLTVIGSDLAQCDSAILMDSVFFAGHGSHGAVNPSQGVASWRRVPSFPNEQQKSMKHFPPFCDFLFRRRNTRAWS